MRDLEKTIEELLEKLAQKEQEAEYYKRLAKQASDNRLRETEELSQISTALKNKISIIEKQRKELEELNLQIARISVTDELTGLLNRRGFMKQAQELFQACRRNQDDRQDESTGVDGFVCAMLDLDFFKKINDRFGHSAGDKVLTDIGNLLSTPKLLRSNDVVGRYGGEEFVITLPGYSPRMSLEPLGRLRQKIRDTAFVIDPSTTIRLTASIGVAEYQQSDRDLGETIDRADDALYYAKEHGRDRLVLFSEISNES